MGKKCIDLIGQRFGKLIVISKTDRPSHLKNSSIYWLCECECGNTKICNSSDLRKGYIKSCGCLKFNDLTNKKFGRLTALYIDDLKISNGGYQWICKCDCGNIKSIASQSLVRGATKSCGCLHNEIAALNFSKREINKINIENKIFGKLTVIKEVGNNLWLCKCECGNEAMVNIYNLIYGNTKSCGCLLSNGEELINNILINYNINFKKQYTFTEWKNTNYWRYRYDFAIFYDNEIKFIIEYDGFHHFGFTNKGWNTEDNYFQTIKSDNYKSNYCNFKEIPLLRIPYWDYDSIEEILLKWLNKFIFKGETNV